MRGVKSGEEGKRGRGIKKRGNNERGGGKKTIANVKSKPHGRRRDELDGLTTPHCLKEGNWELSR